MSSTQRPHETPTDDFAVLVVQTQRYGTTDDFVLECEHSCSTLRLKTSDQRLRVDSWSLCTHILGLVVDVNGTGLQHLNRLIYGFELVVLLRGVLQQLAEPTIKSKLICDYT